jgi:hypothetical protein
MLEAAVGAHASHPGNLIPEEYEDVEFPADFLSVDPGACGGNPGIFSDCRCQVRQYPAGP